MPITFDFSPMMRRRESERAFERQMKLAEFQHNLLVSREAQADQRKQLGRLAAHAVNVARKGDPIATNAAMAEFMRMAENTGLKGETPTTMMVRGMVEQPQPSTFRLSPGERQFEYDPATGQTRQIAGVPPKPTTQHNLPHNIYRMNSDGSMTFAGAGRFNRDAGVTTYQDGSPLGPQDVPVPVQMQATTLKDVAGLPAGARGAAHKKLFELKDQMARLEQVENSLSPEFLEYLPRLQAAATAVAEKAGFKPSAESRRFLAEESKFKANTMRNYNITLAELSGAAVTASEAKRFKPVDPNMDDSYTQFVAKLESGKAYVRSAITRYKDLIERGVIRDGDKVTEQVAADNPLSLYRSPYAGMSLQELIDSPPADADGVNRPWLWDQYIEAMQRAQ